MDQRNKTNPLSKNSITNYISRVEEDKEKKEKGKKMAFKFCNEWSEGYYANRHHHHQKQ